MKLNAITDVGWELYRKGLADSVFAAQKGFVAAICEPRFPLEGYAHVYQAVNIMAQFVISW